MHASPPTRRRSALALALAVTLPTWAQTKTPLRISSPAVPDDWHGKMWTVFKTQLDQSAPGEFDVQINLNGTLFKQGAEPTAMARGNLELATLSAFDIAKLSYQHIKDNRLDVPFPFAKVYPDDQENG